MEDTSEVFNSSGNSNLRDLIMQKLSAAREQKLKQNRSTSNLSNTSKISQLPQVTNSTVPWEEEKQLLLSMLEKSQNSASQATLDRKSLDAKISALTEKNQALSSENKNLKLELERIWSKNPNSKTESFLFEEFKKLEALADEREKKYKEEICLLKEQVAQRLESKENFLKGELIAVEEKLAGLNEVVKEKDKELEKYKRLARNSKNLNTEKTITNALSEFRTEKEKIERNLDRTLKMSCEKESQLSDEIVKLKTINSQLTEQKDNQEKELKGQIASLTSELSLLKKKLHENGKKSNEERSLFDKEKSELKQALEALQGDVKSSEAFSTFYTLKSDLQRAHETIKQQSSTIEQLKEASLQSLDMIPTKEKNNDIKALIISLQKEFSELSAKIKSSEDQQVSEIMQKNNEIMGLHSEIADLRHKIIVFDSKKYENELMLVRSDFHKAVAERVHAKKLIISYIRSVQQLEKMINERIDTETVSQMFKLELNRLNEENKSLVETRQKQEEFFETEMKNMQNVIDIQSSKIQELECKIDATNKLKIKENNEEIKSWVVKNKQLQELNKRIVESLSNIEIKSSQNGKGKPQGKPGNDKVPYKPSS